MIIGKDIHPQRKIYYLGAVVLEILKKAPDKRPDFFDVYQQVNASENISIKLFTLCLDWLYLLGAIRSDKGHIERCF